MVPEEPRNAERFKRIPLVAVRRASKDMVGLEKVGSGVGTLAGGGVWTRLRHIHNTAGNAIGSSKVLVVGNPNVSRSESNGNVELTITGDLL